MNSYDALHVALMHGFYYLGVIFSVAVALMCLGAALAWISDRWERKVLVWLNSRGQRREIRGDKNSP